MPWPHSKSRGRPGSAVLLGTQPRSWETALAAGAAALIALVLSAYLVAAVAGVHVRAVRALLVAQVTERLDAERARCWRDTVEARVPALLGEHCEALARALLAELDRRGRE